MKRLAVAVRAFGMGLYSESLLLSTNDDDDGCDLILTSVIILTRVLTSDQFYECTRSIFVVQSILQQNKMDRYRWLQLVVFSEIDVCSMLNVYDYDC